MEYAPNTLHLHVLNMPNHAFNFRFSNEIVIICNQNISVIKTNLWRINSCVIFLYLLCQSLSFSIMCF